MRPQRERHAPTPHLHRCPRFRFSDAPFSRWAIPPSHVHGNTTLSSATLGTRPQLDARNPRFWAVAFLIWTAFGVLSAAQIFVRETDQGRQPTPYGVFNIVYFYWTWALVTPWILRGARSTVKRGMDARESVL